MARVPIGTQCLTGEICPQSGLWSVLSLQRDEIRLTKGDVFPTLEGVAVYWELVAHA